MKLFTEGFAVPAGKEIVLLRHAKSAAQEAPKGERRKSFALVDAKLHSDGLGQVQVLHGIASKDPKLLSVDIVLCSPLSRAIQTACLTFEGTGVKILLVPELAEFAITKKMVGYENTGRRCDMIQKDALLRTLPKFADVDFSLIRDYNANYGEPWWSTQFEPAKSTAQIQRLKKLLLGLPYHRICLVGHCCNFMTLLNSYHRVPNCTPIWCKLKVNGSRISVVRTDRRSMEKIFRATHPASSRNGAEQGPDLDGKQLHGTSADVRASD